MKKANNTMLFCCNRNEGGARLSFKANAASYCPLVEWNKNASSQSCYSIKLKVSLKLSD